MSRSTEPDKAASTDPDRFAPIGTAADTLLRLGASMLGAGNTAFGTREAMQALARKMKLDTAAVAITLDSITIGAGRGGETITLMRETGLPGVNAWRIAELERLARAAPSGVAPGEVAAKLSAIELTPPLYSALQIAAAVGVASGAFALLNGCGVLEVIAAALGGGIGQGSRSLLARRQFNQYGVAAACAVIASGVYVLIAMLMAYAGVGEANHPAGFMSSVLFLVPGFPLVAALLDLLRHQTAAAVTRMAYGIMLFLAATFGLSIVIGIVRIDFSPQPALELAYPVKLVLRAVASFAGGCGFAMLFNNSARTAVAVGLVATAGNELRLGLHDAGMMLAPATFFGALMVGLLAAYVDGRLDVPRIAITVPGIIIMVPGVYAFEMIVFFNRGEMLAALQAAALCGFATGALGIGLAAARFFSPGERHP
jgi:uncharacterized membrane protein YjjP (DUF1212 family)